MNCLDMVNIPGNINTTEIKENISFKIRQEIITTVGKAFHILYNGKNNLITTANNFCKKGNYSINCSNKSQNSIEEFQKHECGIIISNHQNMNFSDYLPLFSQLGSEILEKCIFYSGEWNIPMNEKLFPNNEFRPATFRTIGDGKRVLTQLHIDIEKIKEEGGYIFLIPAGASTKSEFQSIFERIINQLDSFPVLSSKVTSEESIGYSDIVKNMTNKKSTNISVECKLMQTSDFTDQSKQEMYTTYIEAMK